MGLVIIYVIVAGKCEPVKLAQLCHPACKSSSEEFAKALTTGWRFSRSF
jgi:hypothetical protein